MAFECIKDKLANAPILSYQNLDDDFSLETDASGTRPLELCYLKSKMGGKKLSAVGVMY